MPPPPCCAPDQWEGGLRAFHHDGTYTDGFVALDVKNNRVYEQLSDDPDRTNQIWWFAGEGELYMYDSRDKICTVQTEFGNITQFCLGTMNQTYVTNITLGSADANVYTMHVNQEEVDLVGDAMLCIPIIIDANPIAHIGKNRFHDSTVFYSIVGNVDNFPPVPADCQQGKAIVAKNVVRAKDAFSALRFF